MIRSRDRVLPDQRLLRNERAEVARNRTHIAVRELEPSASKRVRELVWVLVEAPRYLLVSRIEPKRKIGRQHRRQVPLRLVESVGDGGLSAFRLPLFRASRTFRQLPFVLKEVLEEEIGPPGRRLRPGDLRTSGDGVGADTGSMRAFPAEPLILDSAAFWIGTDQRRIARPVSFAEAMPAGNQGDGLFVVHCHAEKRLADVLCRREGIRIAVRPFR